MSAADAEQQPPLEVTLREVKELIRIFNASGWASLDLDFRGLHIVLGRSGPPHAPATLDARDPEVAPARPDLAAAPAPALVPETVAGSGPHAEPPPAAASAPDSHHVAEGATAGLVEVRSPAVGAFWVAPGPGQPPFVEVGQHVGPHQQLAIIEVMKLMNNVSSPVAGRVVTVCAANSEFVEFDQLLFMIEPEDG